MSRPDTIPAAARWTRCVECEEPLERVELARRHFVCPRCGYHFRIGAEERLRLLLDRGSFVELDAAVGSADPLTFPDQPPYEQRLVEMALRTGHREAVITGTGRIGGVTAAIGVLNFHFMGGSMGSAVGEKLTRLIEHGLAMRLPVVIVTASGGARMQEGMFSLLQMAKLTSALARLRAAGIPYLSVLTDPTTGGIAASIAFLGDVNVAEPRALIGFAGPRVMAPTVSEELPEGFQRAEFLRAHGMVDVVVERRDLRKTLMRLVRLLVPRTPAATRRTHAAARRTRERPRPARARR